MWPTLISDPAADHSFNVELERDDDGIGNSRGRHQGLVNKTMCTCVRGTVVKYMAKMNTYIHCKQQCPKYAVSGAYIARMTTSNPDPILMTTRNWVHDLPGTPTEVSGPVNWRRVGTLVLVVLYVLPPKFNLM